MDHLQELTWIRELARTGRARTIREAARISGPEMAASVGVSAASLSRWERGLRTPRPDSAVRWAEALRKVLAV